MPERIYKLQPDRTLSLRGFNTFAAAACIHNATPTGFEVSGTFRDPADFAVAVLYDADNFFEHPSIKYLPDFNFAGLTLDLSLLYTDSLQPMDSPKYNWIDWATLDVIRADGSTAKISLWENAMLADVAFPAASATLNVTSPSAPQFKDEISLWYEILLSRSWFREAWADRQLTSGRMLVLPPASRWARMPTHITSRPRAERAGK